MHQNGTIICVGQIAVPHEEATIFQIAQCMVTLQS